MSAATMPTTDTATVFAPTKAEALVLSAGTGHPFDYTRFVEWLEEVIPEHEATVLPVIDWPEDPTSGFRVVEDVPAELADHVRLAGRVFELKHRVWTLERQLDLAGTFLLGAGRVMEDETREWHEPDRPALLDEVMRRLDVDRTHWVGSWDGNSRDRRPVRA